MARSPGDPLGERDPRGGLPDHEDVLLDCREPLLEMDAIRLRRAPHLDAVDPSELADVRPAGNERQVAGGERKVCGHLLARELEGERVADPPRRLRVREEVAAVVERDLNAAAADRLLRADPAE